MLRDFLRCLDQASITRNWWAEIDVDHLRIRGNLIRSAIVWNGRIRDYLGKILGGSNSWDMRAEYQRALPALLYWIGRVEGCAARRPSLGVENYKFTGMITFALQPHLPQTVFANNQILRIAFSSQKKRNSIEVVNFNLVLSSVPCAKGNSRLTS